MSALDDHLKKHRQKIIDREEKTFREMLSAYSEIEKELKKSFDELQKKIEEAPANGETISPSWFFQEKRLKNLLAQVSEQIIKFGGTATRIVEREQRAAIQIAVSQARETFNFQIADSPDAADLAQNFAGSFNPRTVENAVGLMGDGSPLASYFEEHLAPLVAERIKSEVIKASATGADFKTISKRLTDTGGITKHRALSVARNETNRVRRSTVLEIYRENNDIIEGWEFIASKSNRTCVVCLALDGQVFKLKDEFPHHVNCRCSLVAVIKGLKRRPRTIGADWFDRQSEEIKEGILGKESFDAYRNGDADLKDFIGWRNDKRFGKSVYRKPLIAVLQSKPMKAGAGGNWRRFDEKFDGSIVKQTDLSCVSAVGEMLLKNRGISVSQNKIRDIIGLPSYVEALANCLNRFDESKDGKVWRGFATDLDGINLLIRQKNLGVILKEPSERIGHAVFIDGKTRSGLIKIKDSYDQTSYKMTVGDFWENWNGQVIARWYPKK